MADCRQLTDGRLFVAGGREWAYTTADQDEFGEHTTWGVLAFDRRRAQRQPASVSLARLTAAVI